MHPLRFQLAKKHSPSEARRCSNKKSQTNHSISIKSIKISSKNISKFLAKHNCKKLPMALPYNTCMQPLNSDKTSPMVNVTNKIEAWTLPFVGYCGFLLFMSLLFHKCFECSSIRKNKKSRNILDVGTYETTPDGALKNEITAKVMRTQCANFKDHEN